jgi:hypothetical protein
MPCLALEAVMKRSIDYVKSNKKFEGVFLYEVESRDMTSTCPFCKTKIDLNTNRIKCDHFVYADLGFKLGLRKINRNIIFHFAKEKMV